MIYLIIIGSPLIATLILGAPVGLLVALAGRAAPVWVVRAAGAGLGLATTAALLFVLTVSGMIWLTMFVTWFTVISTATAAAVLAPWVAWGEQVAQHGANQRHRGLL